MKPYQHVFSLFFTLADITELQKYSGNYLPGLFFRIRNYFSSY